MLRDVGGEEADMSVARQDRAAAEIHDRDDPIDPEGAARPAHVAERSQTCGRPRIEGQAADGARADPAVLIAIFDGEGDPTDGELREICIRPVGVVAEGTVFAETRRWHERN